MIETMGGILEALRAIPARPGESEKQLQGRALWALADAGVYPVAEVWLPGGAGRVDFLCLGGVVVEAKVGWRSRSRLAEQCARYLAVEAVRGLVVLSVRRVPGRLKDVLRRVSVDTGKPIEIVSLATGVA